MSKKEKGSVSTRSLMDIEKITDYSLVTPYGELVYFIIHPTNISVLSESSVAARIYSLMNVMKGIAEIEILCLNSKENFDDNKDSCVSVWRKKATPLFENYCYRTAKILTECRCRWQRLVSFSSSFV